MAAQNKRSGFGGLLKRWAIPDSGDQDQHESVATESDIENTVGRALRFSNESRERKTVEQSQIAQTVMRTIFTALEHIKSIEFILTRMQSVVLDLETCKEPERTITLLDRYEDLRNQIDLTTMIAAVDGVNLIDGTDAALAFPGALGYHADVKLTRANLTAGRLGLNVPAFDLEPLVQPDYAVMQDGLRRSLGKLHQVQNMLDGESQVYMSRFSELLSDFNFEPAQQYP